MFKGNGKQVVGIGIYQQSDANTIAVAAGVKKKINEIIASIGLKKMVDDLPDGKNPYLRENFIFIFFKILG